MSKKYKVPINLVGLSSDPAEGSPGDIYFNTVSDVIKIYANDAWRDLSTYSGAVIVGTTAPADPLEGQLWYDNDASQVFVYDGSYWVEIALGPQGPAGIGIAPGGTTNQFLAKSSNNNYETQWISIPAKDLTSTDVSYLGGATSNIQDQIDALATDLGNTSTLYVLIADVGVADGIAPLDATAKLADMYIPSTITRDSEVEELAQDAVGNAVGNGLDYDDTTGSISVDPSEFTLNSIGSPTADVSLASYKITNLASPTSANDAANKAYVDNITAGLNFHAPAQVATTTNLSATYSNGTSGVGATLTSTSDGTLIIDGYTPSVSDRVLVKNQSTGLQNGIYTVANTGGPTNTWVLIRATDADNSPAGEVAYGDFIFVQNGSTNAGYGYTLNTTGTITIGTTSISYVQFNAGQTVIAGNGLTEPTPGTFSIDTAVTADLNSSQILTNKTISGSSNTLSNIANSSLSNSSITINGSAVSLGGSVTIDALPSQTGQSGKYLTTNGTVASWATINLAAVSDNLTMQIMGAY